MEYYKINEDLTIRAESYSNGHNWGHKAYAIYQGREVASAKCVYYNRTWESYKYQSVMQKLVNVMDECKTIPLKDRRMAWIFLKTGDGRELKALGMMGNLAKLAGIIGGNESKARVLASIPGVTLPENFESLPEEEKGRRLNGVINIITK
jgi:hypothetical protein